MSTVLITGGAGYIGSMLARHLFERGHRTVVADALLFGGEAILDLVSRPGFEFVRADVSNRDDMTRLFESYDFDWVVHLASIVGDPACSKRPDVAERTIWDGSRNVFELCEQKGVQRFIFASTCSNYGKMETGGMLDEEAPLLPVSLYAELKVRVERYLLERSTAVDYTILRFATVYGLSLRPRFDLTINEFARDALLKGELEVYGPQFWRPYCHVSDIVQAVGLVLEADSEKVSKRTLNVGCNEENYQKRMIADEIKRQMTVKIIDVEKDEDPRDYRVNFDRIAALGFSPRLRLADGIREISRAISDGLISDPYSDKYRNS